MGQFSPMGWDVKSAPLDQQHEERAADYSTQQEEEEELQPLKRL